MLKKVTLKNFQAHKHLELELGKFTTLTGGSNGGKSAVLRAISALVRNESASDYVRYGQKSLSVTLEFSDGHSVEWIKGSGDNKYVLTSPDGLQKTFDKVGSDVPEEVRSVLKLGPVSVKGGDKEYVNFHNQLEAPFLVSSTPGSVAKLMGELTSASQLYAAVGDGNKKVRSTNALKSTRVSDLKVLKQELESFSTLDGAQVSLNVADSILTSAKSVKEAATEVSKIVDDAYKTDVDLQKLSSGVKVLDQCCSVDIENLEGVFNNITTLSQILDSAVSTNLDLDKIGRATTYLNNAVSTNLKTVETASINIALFSKVTDELSTLTQDLIKVNDEIAKTSSTIESLDESMRDLLDSIDACPTCGTGLTEASKSAMISGDEIHAAH